MATIDETNIFAPKDPNTGQTYQLFDADAIKQKQVQRKSDYETIKKQIASGNIDQAYEGFTQLPFTDQMLLYINPLTGVPLESYEVVKFGAEAQPRFKTFKEFGLDVLDPRKKLFGGVLPSPIKFEDEGSALMSGLAGLGLAGGVFDLVNIPKAIISPFVRKAPLYSTRAEGTGGGGGGISDIPPQPQRDYAGFVSSVEKQALGPQKFGSGKDLISYLESPRRSGISSKELEYLDFDQIRNNPNLTKEDVIKYIQDNRPQIYRVQRSEDNPTYRADESQNPLNELPLNEEATRIANAEEQAYFRDEYAQEIADHNAILYGNPTLQKSDFILNSENINDPSVLEDVEKYLKYDPEAFTGINPAVIEIKYPDGRGTKLLVNEAIITSGNPEIGRPTIEELQEAVKDGATIEFPALAETDDIIEEASAIRVSPDFGNGIEVYETVGDSGTNYKIIGNENTGYRVMIDDAPATGYLGTSTTQEEQFYNDLADARARVQAEAFDNGDILEGADTFDTGSNSEQLLDTAPFDVIIGEATLPTKYGYQQSDYRLPMGGAENYREFTLHISNPKTATRYDSSKGNKHFGGGDELLHYRTTDRIDEDGKRVLFVEEIQSDLHETAGSPRKGANYEMNPKNIDQINKKIGDMNNDFQLVPSRAFDSMYNLKIDNFKMPDGSAEISSMGALSLKEAIEGTRSMDSLGEGLEKTAKDLVDKYGKKEIIDILSELVPLGKAGQLPDYPFKGNDWIELAVKDIIKLADEGGYDRVAFTNAPTQIDRTFTKVNFVKDVSVREIPSVEDYAKSSQFKKDFDKAVETALYDAQKFSNPNITKEELLNQPLNLQGDKISHKGRYDSDAYKLKNTRGDEIHNFVLDEYMKKVNVRGKLPKYKIIKKYTPIEISPTLLSASDSKLADLVPSTKEDFIYPQTTDELLGEFPKEMHEQILKDIEAGNIPKSLDDAQIYELNFKEGSGKKYLDLYDSKLKGALKNVLKKLDKDNKPQKKTVLYSNDDEITSNELLEAFKIQKNLYDETGEDIIKTIKDGEYAPGQDGPYDYISTDLKAHEGISIDITPKMKKTIAEEGVNVYAKGGIVKKLKSMDRPIAGNTRYV